MAEVELARNAVMGARNDTLSRAAEDRRSGMCLAERKVGTV